MTRLLVRLMVAGIIGMWCGSVVQATEIKDGALIVVPAGGGADIFPGKWKITKDQSRGAFTLVEVTDNVTRETPRHKHTREDEAWYVIEGELAFEVGEQKATAGPGTFVYATRDVTHMFKVTKVPAKYLILFTPAGLEGFFAEAAQLRKKYREGTPELQKNLNDLRTKYGLVNPDEKQLKVP